MIVKSSLSTTKPRDQQLFRALRNKAEGQAEL